MRLIASSLMLAVSAAAAPATPANSAAAGLSLPTQIVITLTLLTVLPAVIMAVTPFLRIVVVLHFLRQALGTQSTPSNQILIGLALFLSLMLIQPLCMDVYDNAWKPFETGKLSGEAAWHRASQPVKAYLSKFAREKDVKLMLEASHDAAPRSPEELELRVLVPAYILSELKAAFQIGAVIYLPFLVIDLLVASVTLSLGMVQLPPVMISAPFKLILFVLVDGWNLVVGSLLKSLQV